MSNFARDDLFQRDIRDRLLGPFFYRKNFRRHIYLDGDSIARNEIQKIGIDTVVQARDGRTLFIEEKIVRCPVDRGPYTAFALETKSCTTPGLEKEGWMAYGRADWLLYAFCLADESLELYMIDFAKLKTWFWANEDSFPSFGPLNTINGSFGRSVPFLAVTKNVPAKRFEIADTGLEHYCAKCREPAPFGFYPPSVPAEIWFCGEHKP